MTAPVAASGDAALEPGNFAAAGPLSVPRLPGEVRITRLANGLTLCHLENRLAPVVTCALTYRVGCRDEAPGQGGIAHFLEHMMFKGAKTYGPGEIDRRTQALGGVNNAFTSHDLTTYYFNFAPDRWSEALAIEADRMADLALDPVEVDAERQVILEELSMYLSDPWDVLNQDVRDELFGPHPYGRRVLGPREDLLATGSEELAAFHRRYYNPANAVLVVAGDVGEEVAEQVAEHFGALPGHELPPRPEGAPRPGPRGLRRVERRHGEVARLMLALPAPAATHPDHAPLMLLESLLVSGRASRLTRRLVEEEQLCSWLTADLSENRDPGLFSVVAELVPGADPARVEAEIFDELKRLETTPPDAEEMARARRIAVADWIFGHEQVYRQAVRLGFAVALFDPEHSQRQLARLLATEAEQVPDLAARYLSPETDSVVGWSLPVEEAGAGSCGTGDEADSETDDEGGAA